MCLTVFTAATRIESAFNYGSAPIKVGAILLFFGCTPLSSFSDSLVSLFPRTLPLTELAVLITPDGVSGGVVHGKPVNEALEAATLGTFPRVGVGLLVMTAVDPCI